MYKFPYLLTYCIIDDRSGEWSGEKTGRTERLNSSVNTPVRCLAETVTSFSTRTRRVDEKTTSSTTGWYVSCVSVALEAMLIMKAEI